MTKPYVRLDKDNAAVLLVDHQTGLLSLVRDIDPDKFDTVVGGVRVRPIDELPQIVGSSKVSIGVVATPPGSAQDAADRLVKAGVTSILNFAPVLLSVPIGITVRKVDMGVELQILSYHEQRRAIAQQGAQLHAISVPGSRGATA